MIVDRMQNAPSYYGLGHGIRAALEYLASADGASLSPGRTPIGADGMVLVVRDHRTKGREERLWEAHRRYVDVQLPFDGPEEMGYAHIDSLTVKRPYDKAGDVEIFDGEPEGYVTVAAGSFAIFFPQDVHAPGLVAGGQPADVRKLVVKVPVDLLAAGRRDSGSEGTP